VERARRGQGRLVPIGRHPSTVRDAPRRGDASPQ